MNYVYHYKDENNVVFYVGIGKDYRAWSHLKPSSYMPYDAEYPSFYGRIKKMKLCDIEPTVEIIFEGERDECIIMESELIQRYGLYSEGGTLFNVSKTTGGRVKGKSYPMSEQTLKRYRATCKKNRKYNITSEDLKKLYIDDKMTRQQVADYYGCSDVLVKQRLKEYGIRKCSEM